MVTHGGGDAGSSGPPQDGDGQVTRCLAISLLRLDGHASIAAASRHHARDPADAKTASGRMNDFAVSLHKDPREWTRDRATWQGRVAIAQLRTGNLDEACASGKQTVDLLADHVDSDRGVGFLRTLKTELEPFATAASAQEFLDYASSRLDI